jgi:hypothetical protein
LTLLALVTLGVKAALERKGVPRSLGVPIDSVDRPPAPGPRHEESSR